MCCSTSSVFCQKLPRVALCHNSLTSGCFVLVFVVHFVWLLNCSFLVENDARLNGSQCRCVYNDRCEQCRCFSFSGFIENRNPGLVENDCYTG